MLPKQQIAGYKTVLQSIRSLIKYNIGVNTKLS